MKKQDDQTNHKQTTTTEPIEVGALEESVELKQEEQMPEEQIWKDKYFRVLADYQNLEKRSQLRLLEAQVYAAEKTIQKIIPAIDSLERAVKHIKDDGLALSLKEFYGVLEASGVTRIATVGEQFDPYTMECIQMVDENGDRVVEEVQSGYKLHDKVLRVAKVNVGKNKTN